MTLLLGEVPQYCLRETHLPVVGCMLFGSGTEFKGVRGSTR